ncbi:MAG: lytic transglycosylase domain-containing protein [Pseudoxanthomonas sp.]
MIRVAFALLFGFVAGAQAQVLEVGDDGTVRWLGAEADGDAATAMPATVATLPATVPPRYRAAVEAAAQRHDLSPWLIDAVARAESGYGADAVSPAGAIGIMQLMPDTARSLGVDPRDPAQNIDGGAAYLRQMLDRFDGNIDLALAAYNAGGSHVEQYGGVPPFRETRDYVRRNLEHLAVAAVASNPPSTPSASGGAP